MKEYFTVEQIQAITGLAVPICILIIAIIFKKDISLLIGRIGKNKQLNEKKSGENPPPKSKSKKSHQEKVGEISKPTKNTQENGPESTDIVQSQVEHPLELCMNNSSKKYFIILEEIDDNIARMIIPTGEIKTLKLQLFSEPEIVNADHYCHLLTTEQLESYMRYVIKEDGIYIDNLINNQAIPLIGDEPPYITTYRNMLNNHNTFPSRMLRCIQSEGRISNQELKEILSDRYGYLTETSGSFSASLRVLLVDGYINISGQGDNKKISIIPH